VLSVGKFKTEDEAITLANNTDYGLSAGLHSSEILFPDFENFDYGPSCAEDADQCMRVTSALEAGTVSIMFLPEYSLQVLTTFARFG
jgi:aldehyde dehydrogenase (NAD+)